MTARLDPLYSSYSSELYRMCTNFALDPSYVTVQIHLNISLDQAVRILYTDTDATYQYTPTPPQ